MIQSRVLDWGRGTCAGRRSPSAQNPRFGPGSGPRGNGTGKWYIFCDACITNLLLRAAHAFTVGSTCALRKSGKREQQESSNGGSLHGCLAC